MDRLRDINTSSDLCVGNACANERRVAPGVGAGNAATWGGALTVAEEDAVAGTSVLRSFMLADAVCAH
jgi:hypothetical protein